MALLNNIIIGPVWHSQKWHNCHVITAPIKPLQWVLCIQIMSPFPFFMESLISIFPFTIAILCLHVLVSCLSLHEKLDFLQT